MFSAISGGDPVTIPVSHPLTATVAELIEEADVHGIIELQGENVDGFILAKHCHVLLFATACGASDGSALAISSLIEALGRPGEGFVPDGPSAADLLGRPGEGFIAIGDGAELSEQEVTGITVDGLIQRLGTRAFVRFRFGGSYYLLARDCGASLLVSTCGFPPLRILVGGAHVWNFDNVKVTIHGRTGES